MRSRSLKIIGMAIIGILLALLWKYQPAGSQELAHSRTIHPGVVVTAPEGWQFQSERNPYGYHELIPVNPGRIPSVSLKYFEGVIPNPDRADVQALMEDVFALYMDDLESVIKELEQENSLYRDLRPYALRYLMEYEPVDARVVGEWTCLFLERRKDDQPQYLRIATLKHADGILMAIYAFEGEADLPDDQSLLMSLFNHIQK